MILTQSDIERLRTVLEVSAAAGFESVILEDGAVRGVNESKTCAMVAASGGPVLEQRTGLGRLGALRSRLDLFSVDGLKIEAVSSSRGETASLEISGGRAKAQFRCSSTALISAPSSINDEPCAVVTVLRSEIKTLLDASRALGSKHVNLRAGCGGSVQIEVSDSTNDKFKYELSTRAEYVDPEEAQELSSSYAADVLGSLLRASEGDLELVIGRKGTLSLSIKGFPVTLLPQISDTEG